MPLKGRVTKGVGDFFKRMSAHTDVFSKVVGEKLIPGTINVRVPFEVTIKEDFRLKGIEIGDYEQDYIFEKCSINGIAAYRIRPLNLRNGSGGWGDNTLEISSTSFIENAKVGDEVEILFFRELS